MFATLLKANGEDVRTVQELPRHATSAITMKVYAKGVSELKGKAHHRIARMSWAGSLRKMRTPVTERNGRQVLDGLR